MSVLSTLLVFSLSFSHLVLALLALPALLLLANLVFSLSLSLLVLVLLALLLQALLVFSLSVFPWILSILSISDPRLACLAEKRHS